MKTAIVMELAIGKVKAIDAPGRASADDQHITRSLDNEIRHLNAIQPAISLVAKDEWEIPDVGIRRAAIVAAAVLGADGDTELARLIAAWQRGFSGQGRERDNN